MTYLRLLAHSSLVTVAPVAYGQGVLPGDATVVSGDAVIATSGPAMTITQDSDKAILDWTEFSIGEHNSVSFLNGSGTTLNRVTGGSVSSLDGLLRATGTIYLINPNGIVIGQNGIVDVGGSFVAATHDVDNAAFLAGGDLDFSGMSDASVINLGKVAAAQGDVFLIAREVLNEGTIEAANGTAGLAAGYDVLLTDGSLGDGKLQVRVGGTGTSATTRGTIEAAGVELRANGGNIYALAGNTGGTIRATGVSESDGRIFLTAETGNVTVAGGVTLSASRGAASTLPAAATGSDDAPGMQVLSAASGMDGSVSDTGSLLLAPSSATSGTGGDFILSGGKVSVSGEIAATGTEGGSVTITGTDIAVVGGRIDASGETGGGTVLIGGNKYGASGLPTADTLYFDADSLVRADATVSGNGGQVVLWADGTTRFAGNISARGSGDGTGGDAEVSGKAWLDYSGFTDLRGPDGFGTLLLDPYNLTISSDPDSNVSGFDATGDDSVINVTTLEAALASANVTISTGSGGSQDGDITIADAFSWSSGSLLTLSAYQDIIFDAEVTASDGSGLALEYGQGAIADGNTATYTVNAPINLTSDGSFSTKLGSDGTVIDYTIITSLGAEGSTTTTDLQGINGAISGGVLSDHFILGSDIDASDTATWNSGEGFEPLANGSDFTGTFDGLGHTISNLTINRPSQDEVGLIAATDGDASIRNLSLVDADVTGNSLVGFVVGQNLVEIANVYASGLLSGGDYVGGLAGDNAGTITNSSTEGTIAADGEYIGGIAGSSAGTISTVNSSMEINGGSFVGGLVGRQTHGGSVVDSHASGAITTDGTRVGGLVGDTEGGTLISNSYATGAVSAEAGIAGGLTGSNAGTVEDSYATGTVTTVSGTHIGGLSGANTGSITDSYATGEVSSTDQIVGGLVGENGGSIVDSHATGKVSGSSNVGGLVGSNNSDGSISYSYATGTVSGTEYRIGGLVGMNTHTASIANSYATGNVSSDQGNVGGLVGLARSSSTILNSYATGDSSAQLGNAGGLVGTLQNSANITNSYSTGAVSNITGEIGGLVGQLRQSGTVTASFYNIETSGRSDTGRGTGLTTLQMRDPFTFIDAGWDLESDWGKSVVGENDEYLILRGFSSGVLYDDYVRLSGNTSKTYGDANPSLDGITLDGFGTDNVTLSWGSGISETTGAGYYAYDSDAGNVEVESADGRTTYIDYGSDGLTISKAALTITADDDSKIYDGLSYSGGNGITYDGFVNSEDDSVLGGTLAYGGTSQGATNAGNYAIEVSGLTADNYDITFVDGALEIDKASLTITFDDDSKTYDGLAYSGGNGFTYDGFVNSEDDSVLGGTLSYAGTAQGASDAGSYTITASGLTADNYDISYVAGALEISKAALTVTADDDSKTYDGLAYSGGNGLTYDGFVNSEDDSVLGGTLSYSGTAQGASDAGSYTITASGLTADNYDITFVAGALEIDKAALTITADDDSKTYDGLAYSGGNGLTYDGFVNSEDDSVLGGTLSYGGTAQGASDAGSYTITASGLTADNYDVTFVAGALEIDKAALTVTADDDSKIYDGLSYSGGNGITYDGFVNSEDDSVLGGTLAYGGTSQGATNAGNYAIEVSGLTADNYDITFVDGALEIDKASLTITFDDDSKTYDGLAYSGSNGFTYDGFVNSEDDSVLGGTLSYASTAQGASDAGSYTITASGLTADNYDISYVAGALEIDKATLTVTASDDSKTYDGLAYSGGNGVTYDGFVNGEDDSVLGGTLAYGGSSQGAVNAVEYTITASGLDADNYTISYVDGTLDIGMASLTVTASDDSKTYDGLAYSGGNGITYDGFVNGEDDSVLGGTLAYGGDAQGATDAGDYTITASGLSAYNYTISYVDGTLDVGKASLTVTASDDSKTYDGLAYSGGNGVTYDGFVSGEDDSVLGGTLAYGGDAQDAKDAGSYAIEASGLDADNYAISYVDGTLDVGKASLTVTASDDSKTYDGLTYSGGNGVTYDGFVSGEDDSVLSGTLAYGGTSQSAKDTGSYVIEASGLTSGNYDISFSDGALTVDKASLTVTASDDSKTYDGLAYSGGNGITYDGFVDGEDDTVLSGTLAYGGTSQGAKDAGSYAIEASGLDADNYAISYVDGTLDVGKASLTVTASDDSKTYDGLAYSGGNGVTYDGFVSGEDDSVLGGTLAYGGDAQDAKDAGSYAIEASGLDADNYTISYVDGTLDVGKASLTVTASDDSKTYDGLAYSGGNGVTYDGFVDGEDETVLGGTLTYGGDAQDARDAGLYTIETSGLTSGNYDITYIEGALDVARRAITILADAQTKIYGDVDPDLTYTIGGSGLASGDTVAGVLSGELDRAAGETVADGPYAIGQGSLSANDNYTFTYVGSDLSITPAELIIIADNQSKIADGSVFEGPYTVTMTGLANGDDASSLGPVEIGGTALTAINTGTYDIVPGGVSNSNYRITFVNGTLTLLAPVSSPFWPQEVPETDGETDLGPQNPGGEGVQGLAAPGETDSPSCGNNGSGDACSNMPHPLNQTVDGRIRFTP